MNSYGFTESIFSLNAVASSSLWKRPRREAERRRRPAGEQVIKGAVDVVQNLVIVFVVVVIEVE